MKARLLIASLALMCTSYIHTESNMELKGSIGEDARKATTQGVPLNAAYNIFPASSEGDLQLKGSVGQIATHETQIGIPLNKATKIPLNIEIGGYIKSEGAYDSRQNEGGADNQYLLFPKKILCDPTGRDINHQAQFDLYAIESRANFALNGPQVFSAKARSVMEWDFWGSRDLIRRVRLRHAFVRLDWEDTSFLTGQFWHPIFVDECYPDTISFNSGAPFDPYGRNPQIRVTPQFGDLKLILAAITQLNNVSNGPIGYSSTYMRDAHLPNLHAQLQMKANTHYFGVGMDFKRLVPRIESNTGYKVNESITSLDAIGYVALNFNNFKVHAKCAYIENGTEYDTLSGYAVHCIDPVTDGRSYTNLRCVNVWMDIILRHGNCEPGIFGGYSQNLGSRHTIIKNDPVTNASLIYTLDANVGSAWRLSPRIRWFFEPVILGVECEYTTAAHGDVNDKGVVENAIPVGNCRLLAAAWYNF